MQVSDGSSAISAVPRSAVVNRLLALDLRGELSSRHVELMASVAGVSERTLWRWLRAARQTGSSEPARRERLAVDDDLRRRLAFWRGNVAAVHRELAGEAAGAGGRVPSLRTLHRAVARDLTAGERAGLRAGERARRAHDVFLRRPVGHRNEVWETDHVEVPVQVAVAGRWCKPWVTWFVDVATSAVCGLAVTPGYPSRESILAALRSAILRDDRYGAVGGLPGRVRMDRGRDFLSATVGSVLAALAVVVEDLPAYQPHLKGTVEQFNRAAEQMFFAGLPRYTHGQQLADGRGADPEQPGLAFEAFVALLLDWVAWWNTEHRPDQLGGRTPAQAWAADPTPVQDVPREDLRLLTLEDDGRQRVISGKGVQWRSRFYVADWMAGRGGEKVRIRYMPHHEHEIEVFDAGTGRHMGAAFLADAATAEQIAEVRRARAAQARRLRADLRAAEATRRERFAAVTVAEPAQALGALTAEQAGRVLADAAADDAALARLGRADVVPVLAPPAGWALPRPATGTGQR